MLFMEICWRGLNRLLKKDRQMYYRKGMWGWAGNRVRRE